MLRLDFFPKFIDSAMSHKTNFGAVTFFVMIFTAGAICISEIKAYVYPPFKEQLISVSSVKRSQELVISFNFTVSVPCVLLHLDSFDMISPTNDPEAKSFFKLRVNEDGSAVQAPPITEECGSCYGAESNGNACCRTCEDIVTAYQRHGMSLANMKNWTQCINEGIKYDGTEKCQTYGSLKVNAIEGGFHIAPGVNRQSNNGHHHDYSPIKKTLNLSHEIEHITFGHPMGPSPLDGTRVIQEKPGRYHFRYNLRAVPTIRKDPQGNVESGFQFTVNPAEIPVNEKGRNGPGLFFQYSFSPVAVVKEADRPSGIVLFARIVSVCGGAFMLARLIDSFMYRLNTIEGKARIGKAA